MKLASLVPTNAARRLLPALLVLAANAGSCAAASGAGPDLYPFSIDQDRLSGIVDFSDLSDGPLRNRDRLIVCGNRICKVGEAGSSGHAPVRLFGVTLAHDAVFPSDAEADLVIARLRRLGVNLVRLHGFDTVSDSAAGGTDGILLSGPFPTLNPEALRRLKRFLVKLRDAGIYVDLNLHVAYQFRPAVDNVPFAFPGDSFMPDESKPLYVFDDKMSSLQAQYVRALFAALGPSMTNVVAIVEISNESSLVYEWANGRLDRDVKGRYREELAAKWIAFQKESGRRGPLIERLPARKDALPDEVQDRFVAFLTALDKSYLERMRNAVKSAAPDVLVVGTQMGYGGFQNLVSNESMDIMDSHVYVDHYGFLGKFFDWNTWYIRDVSSFDSGLTELRNVAFYRSLSKPYIVSEYNQPWPNRQAAEMIPLMSALASLQDWSAIVFYDYSNTRADFHAATPREFVLDTDFTKLPVVGPMAWLYRTFDVKPAGALENVRVSDSESLASIREGVTDESANFVARSLAVDTQAVFSTRIGISRAGAGAYSPTSDADGSDPAALGVRFDTDAKQMVFDTPMLVGVVGRVAPNHERPFGRFAITLDSDARGFVTFIAMSRDQAPIDQSRHMLWVLPGYSLGSKPGVRPAEPEFLTAADVGVLQQIKDAARRRGSPNRFTLASTRGKSGYGVLAAQAPIWMERVGCVISMPHAFADVTVYPLDGTGRRLAPLSGRDARLSDGVLTVHLQAAGQPLSPWYELTFK